MKIKNTIYLILALVIIALAGLGIVNRTRIKEVLASFNQPELPEAIAYNDLNPAREEPINAEATSTPESISSTEDVIETPSTTSSREASEDTADLTANIPGQYNLAVPFRSQAPKSDWSLPFQEACEEASLIMTDAYFSGSGLTADDMEKKIRDLVDWERKNLGYYEDTTAAEVAKIAKDYFGLSATLDTNVTTANIKKHIAAGKLVIVPAAGRMLGNPNFTGQGPLYHMLVIRGYTNTHFITNDPGTRKGNAYTYKYNTLINAIHDWPRSHGGYTGTTAVSEADMKTGRKVMIVIDK